MKISAHVQQGRTKRAILIIIVALNAILDNITMELCNIAVTVKMVFQIFSNPHVLMSNSVENIMVLR